MRTSRALGTVLFVFVAVASLAACGGKGEANAEGTVGEIQSATDRSVTFLLQEDDINSPMNNAMITVSAANLEGSTPAELATGDPVKVWASVCAQSFPPQCEATSVVVGE